MRSKDLIANAKKANAATLAAAFQTGDETKMTEALATFCGDIEEAVLQQASLSARRAWIEIRGLAPGHARKAGLHGPDPGDAPPRRLPPGSVRPHDHATGRRGRAHYDRLGRP